jgi:hypothetical protein
MAGTRSFNEKKYEKKSDTYDATSKIFTNQATHTTKISKIDRFKSQIALISFFHKRENPEDIIHLLNAIHTKERDHAETNFDWLFHRVLMPDTQLFPGIQEYLQDPHQSEQATQRLKEMRRRVQKHFIPNVPPDVLANLFINAHPIARINLIALSGLDALRDTLEILEQISKMNIYFELLKDFHTWVIAGTIPWLFTNEQLIQLFERCTAHQILLLFSEYSESAKQAFLEAFLKNVDANVIQYLQQRIGIDGLSVMLEQARWDKFLLYLPDHRHQPNVPFTEYLQEIRKLFLETRKFFRNNPEHCMQLITDQFPSLEAFTSSEYHGMIYDINNKMLEEIKQELLKLLEQNRKFNNDAKRSGGLSEDQIKSYLYRVDMLQGRVYYAEAQRLLSIYNVVSARDRLKIDKEVPLLLRTACKKWAYHLHDDLPARSTPQ